MKYENSPIHLLNIPDNIVSPTKRSKKTIKLSDGKDRALNYAKLYYSFV